MPLLAIAARLGAGKLIKKAAGWAGRQVLGAGRALGAKTVGGAIARTAGGAVITTAAGAAATRVIGRMGVPSLPPGFAPQGIPRAPVPTRGPVRRGVERILPGGRTGREFTPATDGTDKFGRPIAVFPESVERAIAPAGYVLVEAARLGMDAEPGEKVAVLKGVARSMGLWQGRPKPPVSGWDMRAINRAHSAQKRVKKLASKVGFTCAKKGRKC